jgi:quercetin dioxygenase-like cupin family protein
MNNAIRTLESLVHLGGRSMSAWSNDERFWQLRDRPELTAGHILSVFAYEETWSYQERHPAGDEIAILLGGDAGFLVDAGEGERAVHLDVGCAFIVPEGAWHRAAIHAPSTILFVTPVPALTETRRLATPTRS